MPRTRMPVETHLRAAFRLLQIAVFGSACAASVPLTAVIVLGFGSRLGSGDTPGAAIEDVFDVVLLGHGIVFYVAISLFFGVSMVVPACVLLWRRRLVVALPVLWAVGFAATIATESDSMLLGFAPMVVSPLAMLIAMVCIRVVPWSVWELPDLLASRAAPPAINRA